MKQIIVADDHGYIRLGLIQILRDEYPSVEIREVSNGESLINEVILHDYDLIISDLDMPGLNGLEALEKIKLIKPHLPILILSIYTEELYAVRVLKAGAAGYMNKNAAPYELITAIQRILLGKKYITPEIAERLLVNTEHNKKTHALLSNREFEVFKLIVIGKTISQIADSLSLALTTISTHRSRILEKLGLTTNSELTRYAIAHHLISGIEM
jgi:two-component system, NarL family, invasion response regulator UvrY